MTLNTTRQYVYEPTNTHHHNQCRTKVFFFYSKGREKMQLNTTRQYKNCILGVVYETTNTHHHNRCGLRFFFFLILRGERENGTQHHTPVLKLHAAVQLSNVRITKKTWKKCSYFPLPFEYQKKKKVFIWHVWD